MNFKHLLSGHINELRSLLDLTRPDEEKVFATRKKICDACPLKSGNSCNPWVWIHPETLEIASKKRTGFVKGCGCRLSAKQKSIHSKCPANFWGNEFSKSMN